MDTSTAQLVDADVAVMSPREHVLARCRALDWSQNHLARRCGYSPTFMSALLRGTTSSKRAWKKIARTLEVAEARRARRKNA